LRRHAEAFIDCKAWLLVLNNFEGKPRENAEMGFFKRLKFWEREENRKTGVVRGVLKCLVPCIRQRSRSPSPESNSSTQENKTLENCKKITNGLIGAQCEAQIEPQRGQEVIDLQEMTREEENPLPESSGKKTTHGLIYAQCEALIQGERQQELNDIQKMTREEETRKGIQESPHSAQCDDISFEETEQGRRREESGLRLSDFKQIKLLGKGGFGQVVLAKKKSTGDHRSSEEEFALKFVPNERVCEVEKEVFIRAVGHPFLVQLLAYFQTNESLCFVMEYMEGGTLFSLLCRGIEFSEDLVQFYAAEIILAVNFLHKCGIVHRDIKPGNILLDRDGHCKLADFGLCKVGMFKLSRTYSVCGTNWYKAPEIRRCCGYGPEVDWWSVGCVMQDMMFGLCCRSEVCVYHKWYPTYLTEDGASILRDFLNKDPRKRLGADGDTRSILKHPFFKTVNWEAVLQKRVAPPLTWEFLTVDPDSPGGTDESGNSISFKSAVDVNASGSNSSFQSAVE
jgi:hypothetical protein